MKKQAVILIGLAIFFLAATILRVEEFAGETDSTLIAWCYGIVLLGATIGPALIYVRLSRDHRLAREAYRNHRFLKRQLRTAQRELSRARKAIERKARARERWNDKAQRMKAEAKLSRKEE